MYIGMASHQQYNRLNVQDAYPVSPYSSHSGASSNRSSMNSMDSQASRHYNAQEQGSGNYQHDSRTPPVSYGSHSQPVIAPGHSHTSSSSVVSGFSRGVKLPPSMRYDQSWQRSQERPLFFPLWLLSRKEGWVWLGNVFKMVHWFLFGWGEVRHI